MTTLKDTKEHFYKKKLFSSLLRRGRCPIALTIAAFPLHRPFYICSRVEFFKTFHFEMQEQDSIRAYCQQLLRCAAVIIKATRWSR